MAECPVTLIPAAELSVSHLAFLINRAYSDYFLSVQLDELQVARMCDDEDIDLQKSVVAMIDGEPVGLAFLSLREDRGWVSGVGVHPSWRRRGIALEILRSIQALARTEGIQILRLEVLEQNMAGLALYKQLGFDWERELLVLTLEPGILGPIELPPGVGKASPATLLEFYTAFHDMRSPWQREFHSLVHRVFGLAGLGFWDDQQLVGYLLYQPQSQSWAIYDLAVDPTYPERLQVAQTLLIALNGALTDAGSYIINLPVEDSLLPAFTSVYYSVWLRQHELAWSVK